jgi:phosphatidylethanolamine-binding protein (PEBP) family uncharacterized protein
MSSQKSILVTRRPLVVLSRARTVPWLRGTAILAIVVLSGCAENASSPHAGAATDQAAKPQSTAHAAREKVPSEDIDVRSSVPLSPVPARYTCDGANISPPFRWTRLPHGTVEVDLFVVSGYPVHGKFVVVWAVAGLSPRMREVSSARLPPQAIIGRNSFGRSRYSLCPKRGRAAQFAVLLYALLHKIPVATGFNAEKLIEGTLVHVAPSEGELFFSYRRH